MRAAQVQARQLTPGEALLEQQWDDDLRPILQDLIRVTAAALATSALLTASAAELTRLILAFYASDETLLRPLANNLHHYGLRAFNLGGQMGLDALGINAPFELEDEGLLALVAARMARLSDIDGELSLPQTTAEEIARQIARQREAHPEWGIPEVIDFVARWALARSAVRGTMIAATEGVRMTRTGLVITFLGNDCEQVYHICEANVEELCTTQVCVPLCGKRYLLAKDWFNPLKIIPPAERIPLHPFCRCKYEPDLSNWTRPAVIWTGFALAELLP